MKKQQLPSDALTKRATPILVGVVASLVAVALALAIVVVATAPTQQSISEKRAAAFGLSIVWSSKSPCANGVLGCYSPATPDRIYIDPAQKNPTNQVDFFIEYAQFVNAGIKPTNCQVLAAAKRIGSTETEC